MNRSKYGFSIISMSLVLILGLVGCASTKQAAQRPSPLPRRYHALQELAIAIVPKGGKPQVACIAYEMGGGRGAAKGASDLGKKGAIGGLKAPFYLLLQCRDPREGAIVFVLLPVLVPVCGLGGALIGASAGAIDGAFQGDYREMPMSTVEELKEIAAYLSSMTDLNKALAEHLLEAGQKLTKNSYTIKDEIDLNNKDDAILTVNITRIVYKGEIEWDPDISFEMEVHIELTDSADTFYFSDVFYCVSDDISLSHWTKNKGRPFEKELHLRYQEISEKIIKDLFIRNE